MKCILHVGTEKTATTTLQSFFDLNRKELLKNNFLYSQHLGKTNHFGLVIAAYDDEKYDELTSQFNIFSKNDLTKHIKKVKSKLRSEIQKNKCNTLIFSSEHFHSRLTKDSELQKLKLILEELGVQEFEIIVYLREQSSLVSSLYSTAIKYGDTAALPPLPHQNEYYDNICNHQKTIQRFQNIFGKNSVKPKLYAKEDFFNNNIIADFLKQIGLVLNDNFIFPQNKNISLNLLGLRILSELNKSIPFLVNGRINSMRKNLIECFEKSFSEKNPKIYEFIVKAYQQEYAAENEWVRKNFFPQKAQLFTFNSQTIKLIDFNENDIKAISELVYQVLNK